MNDTPADTLVSWQNRTLNYPYLIDRERGKRPPPPGTEVNPHFEELLIDFRRGIEPYPAERFAGRGIVTCAGGDLYNANAYVLFRLLRHLGCTLPIECWYLGDPAKSAPVWPIEDDPGFRELCEPLGVEFRNAYAAGFAPHETQPVVHFPKRSPYPLRAVNGYRLKPFAVLHSRFQEVLFADADNTCQVDPTFLFECPEFRQSGMLLWPDLGCESYLPGFALHDSKTWGTETGQMLFDKSRAWETIVVAAWFADWADYTFQFSWGDKELHHVAALWCVQDFGCLPFPRRVRAAGYVQHAPDGSPLFFHRCSPGVKWPLEGPAKEQEGFRWHRECVEFLEEWRVWKRGSTVPSSRAVAPASVCQAYGLSRSGIHTLAHWMASNRPGTVVFRNWPRSDGYDLTVYRDGIVQTSIARGQARGSQEPTHPDLRIQTWEEAIPEPTEPGDTITVLLLRDPLNWLASRVRQPGRENPWGDVPLWNTFAKRWRDAAAHEIQVLYPEWFRSPQYREHLARRLGVGAGGRGLDHVPAFGGGSSFDGMEFDGRGRAMNILGRWRDLLGRPEFAELLQSADFAEMLMLGLTLFGHLPEVCETLESVQKAASLALHRPEVFSVKAPTD